jgi:phosphonate transport system substrate-binding protein
LKRKAFLALPLFLALCVAITGCEPPKPETTATAQGTGSNGASSNSGDAPTQLTFGFVPSAEADKIADTAKPMCDFLTQELGIPVTSKTTNDYVGLLEAMKSGSADIGSLPPLGYVLAKDQNAATVLLKTSRKKSLTYHANFFARKDSGITKIEDAKGKKLSYVDELSTSGYLFPMSYLKKQSIDPKTFFAQMVPAGAHDAALRAIYDKQTDVACAYDMARNKLEKLDAYKDVKDVIVPIGDAGEIPNDTISVRSSLSPELAQKIKDALLKYAKTPEGAKTLMDVYEIDDLVEAKDEDYESVRMVAKEMGVQFANWQEDVLKKAEAKKKAEEEKNKAVAK